MKKRIIIPLIIILTLLVCLTACNKAEYTISTDRIDGVIVAGESVDLDGIYITRTEGKNVTEISVRSSMVSGLDTSSAGNKTMVVKIGDETFEIRYTVKYRVEFVADGEVVDTQLVLDTGELVIPAPVEKEGYTFLGYDVPSVIRGNIRCEARYEAKAGTVKGVTATFGDTLADITLPSTSAGRWEFVDSADTSVGPVGSNVFDIRFVLRDGSVLETSELTVKVEKKKISFEDLVTSFVYDGESHYPTYTVPDGIAVIKTGSRQTDAGTYDFMLIIESDSYEGVYSGTFEITRPSVDITVGSYTITYGDASPKVEYTVIGIDTSAVDLGITVDDISAMAGRAGTHSISLTVSNKNVIPNITPGTLTVLQASLDPGAPILTSDTAVYGDLLSSIGFESHGNGRWSWVDPGSTVGDVGTNVHKAVFTPNSSNYASSVHDVAVNVAKKQLTITVATTGFVYDGTPHSLTPELSDELGNIYTGISILGNNAYTDAGSYSISLSLDDARYYASSTVIMTIDRAVPVCDFSTVLSATWYAGLTLADVELPDGYEWKNSSTGFSSAVGGIYPATYTHPDANNYVTVDGEFTVNVSKAEPEIINLAGAYETVYNANVYEIAGISASYGSGSFSFRYYLAGVDGTESEVSEIRDAGSYRVEVTLAETQNYKSVTAETFVTVNKAENKDSVLTEQNRIYGDSISSIALPESTVGSWSIKGKAPDELIGDVGAYTLTAVFTPSSENENNYSTREVTLTVNVSAKGIDVPSIADRVYTGLAHDIVIDLGIDASLYSVEGDVHVTDASDSYSVTVTLNTDNYKWNDTEGGSARTVSYKVTRATVTLSGLAIESWTYGDEASEPTVTVSGFSGADETVEVIYTYEVKLADGSYSVTAEVVNAGEYRVKARITDTANYIGASETAYVYFTVEKRTVDDSLITVVNDSLVYTGYRQYSGIVSQEGVYTVVDNGGINANTDTGYLVSITVGSNYRWQSTEESTITRTYYIAKAQAVIDSETLDVGGWTYNEVHSHSGTSSFGTVEFRYYECGEDGAYTEITLSSNPSAGTYYAVAYVEGTSDYDGTSSDYIEFEVSRATPGIIGAKSEYTAVYSGEAYLPTGLYASYGEGVFTLSDSDGNPIIDAGSYENAVITLAQSENYTAVSVTVGLVTIEQADVTVDSVPALDATYGDLLSSVELPEAENGSWTWQTPDVYVGNVSDVNTFTAIFTPYSSNYRGTSQTVTVNVSKAEVAIPSFVGSFVYGDEADLEISATDLYDVPALTELTAGTHTLQITLSDSASANYKWASSDSDSVTVISESVIEITYVITKASSEIIEGSLTVTDKIYDGTAIAPSADATYGSVEFIYYVRLADGTYSALESAPSSAGTYYLKPVVEDDPDGNYIGITADEISEYTEFVIAKAEVRIPEYNSVFTYGESVDLTDTGISETDYYTAMLSYAGTVNGVNEITLTLKDSGNYIWQSGDELSVSLSITVLKADNSVTVTLPAGAVYDGTTSFEAVYTVAFGTAEAVYERLEDGSVISSDSTAPVSAGTYRVRITVADTADYAGISYTSDSFTVAKATGSVSLPDSYTGIVYDGSEFEIPASDITCNHSESELIFTIVKDGTEVTEMVDAGTYTVTVTLTGTNYTDASASTTVVIDKAEADSAPSAVSAVYGTLLSSVSIPADSKGTWSWYGYADDTTVGNVNDLNRFTAIFTPYAEYADNYRSDTTAEITVNVSKYIISVPSINNFTYSEGVVHRLELSDDILTYCDISGDIEAESVGVYTVTFTIRDFDNLEWSTVDTAEYSRSYEVTISENNSWTVTPSISDITYGETLVISAQAAHGGYDVKYRVYGSAAYLDGTPTDAGYYVAVFTTTDTNYGTATAETTFRINAFTVQAPVFADSYTYGDAIDRTVFTDSEYSSYFTLVSDTGAGQTAVGSYRVTLELDDPNYVWSDTSSTEGLRKYYDYTIIQASVVLSDLAVTVDGWTYLDDPDSPFTVTVSGFNGADCVTVIFSYSEDGVTYTEGIPAAAGTYYLKAVALDDEDGNYIGTELVMSTVFTIAKAVPTITIGDSYEFVYSGAEHRIPEAETSNDDGAEISYVYPAGGIVNSGVYTVTVEVSETDNYLGVSADVTVTVIPADNTEDTVDTEQTLTYGGTVASLVLPDSAIGTWEWRAAADSTDGLPADGTLGDVGVYTLYAVYIPDSNHNAEIIAVTVTVVPADNTEDTVDAEQTLTYGDSISSLVLPESSIGVWSWRTSPDATDDISLDTQLGNVGEYTLYAIFTPDKNHNAASAEVTVTVNKMVIDLPEIANNSFMYGDEITADMLGYTESALYSVDIVSDGTVNGTNYAEFILTDAENYEWSTADNTRSITIETADVSLDGLDVTVADWTYLDDPDSPFTVTVSGFNGADSLTVRFFYSEDGMTYIEGIPTEAGTYYLKAVVDDDTDGNYNGAELVMSETFTIAQRDGAVIEDISETYDAVYSESGTFSVDSQIIATLGSSYSSASFTYEITRDGVAVSEITGAGDYTVTVYMTDTNGNYSTVTEEVTVSVAKADIDTSSLPYLYATYLDNLENVNLSSLPCDKGTWSWPDASLSVGGASESGNSFTIMFTPSAEYADNYNALDSVTVAVIVARRGVDVPVAEDKVYTASSYEDIITASELYTLTGDIGWTAAATHTAYVTLTDSDNYEWNTTEGLSDGGATVAISFTILRAEADITVSLDGWTYGASAGTPSASADFAECTEFSFEYSEDGVSYTDTVPTLAGDYFVRARYDGNDNILLSYSETLAFTISKAVPVINISDSYTFVYSGSEYTLPVPSTTNTDSVTVECIYVDGAIITVGEYRVTFSTPESANFLAVSETVTVTVEQLGLDLPELARDSFTYGETVTLSEALGGTESSLYTASLYTDGNVGGSNYVEFTLTDAVNYKWNGTQTRRDITIVRAENSVQITLPAGSIYDGTTAYGASVITAFGSDPAVYYYRVEDGEIDESTESTSAPVCAGTYVVRVVLVGTANYSGIDVTSDSFTVAKRDAVITVGSSFTHVYDGAVYTIPAASTDSDAGDGAIIYTYPDGGIIDVGSYTVAVTVPESDNYNAASVYVTVNVTKGTASISGLAITPWKYGESANVPTASNDGGLGTVMFRYLVGGQFIDALPADIDAGTYQVQAYIEQTDNYYGCETALLSFTITEADGAIYIADSFSTVYTGSAYSLPTDGITLTHGLVSDIKFTYKDGNGNTVTQMVDAGTYTVTLSISSSTNYTAASRTVTVVIEKVENTDDFTPYATQSVPYGTLMSALQLPTGNPKGEWKLVDEDGNAYGASDTVGEIGTSALTAKFFPNDSNYAERTETVTVTVTKKTVTPPTALAGYREYNGTDGFTAGIEATADYTVTDEPVYTAGTHYATATLTDPAHYEWTTTSDATVQVEFYVERAQSNSWVTAPSIDSYTYDGSTPTWTAVPTYDTVVVQYSSDGGATYTDTAPTLPGRYVAKFTTSGENAVECTAVTREFTIWRITVTAPTLTYSVDNPFYYADYAALATLEGELSSTLYTYTGLVMQGGTNTVTVSLTDTSLYCWSISDLGVEDISDKEYQYKVNAVTLAVEVVMPDRSYTDAPSTPVITVYSTRDTAREYPLSEVPVSWTYSTSGNTIPVNAGTYTVNVVIEEAAGWYALSDSSTTFTISPATPTINLSLDLSKTYYQNQIDWAGYITVSATMYDGTVVKPSNQNCTVTVTFDEANSTYSISFTSADPNFTDASASGTIILKTVATVGFGGTKYGTIENALEAAASGDEVWVLTDTTGNVRIERDVAIPAGVTLVMPYDMTSSTSGRNQANSAGDYEAERYGTANQKNYPSRLPQNAVCYNLVTVASGITLTVNGNLEISGILSGGQGGSDYSGHTIESCAKLMLEEGAEVVINGVAKVFGFINETSDDNGSKVTVNNGGSLYMPYVLRDFKGGSKMYAAYNKMNKMGYSPFSQYTMMNVSSLLRINYGGNMYVFANLYAGDQQNATTSHCVGVVDTSFLQLTDSQYSYIESKYNVSTEVTDLRIYGGATLNSMSLSVTVITSITVCSEDFVFALPWLYNITLDNNEEDAGNVQDVAKFVMPHSYKMLPGNTFTVEQGAYLEIGSLSVYETFIDLLDTCPYPTVNPNTKEALEPALLTVRGELVAANLGGHVYTDTDGARVTVTDSVIVTTNEITAVSGTSISTSVSSYQSITNVLQLHYGDNVFGYTNVNSYTSESSIENWTADTAIVLPELVTVTVGDGYRVTTDLAIELDEDGKPTYKKYDSATDGNTFQVYAGSPVIFHLLAHQVLSADGSTGDIDGASLGTSDYTVTWLANASEASTFKVYTRMVVSVSSSISLYENTVTYKYDSTSGYYYAVVKLQSGSVISGGQSFTVTTINNGNGTVDKKLFGRYYVCEMSLYNKLGTEEGLYETVTVV